MEWFFITQSSAIPTQNIQIPMLGFSCGWSTTYWRLNMPVQMMELEEMTMVEASDEVLEALVTVRVWTGVGRAYTNDYNGCSC